MHCHSCATPTSSAGFVVTRDLTISEVTIRGGEVVLLVLGSVDRDLAQFADPDTLDLARELSGQRAFGHGVPYCLGAASEVRGHGRVLVAAPISRWMSTWLTSVGRSIRTCAAPVSLPVKIRSVAIS